MVDADGWSKGEHRVQPRIFLVSVQIYISNFFWVRLSAQEGECGPRTRCAASGASFLARKGSSKLLRKDLIFF
jgi:hypothetical protein